MLSQLTIPKQTERAAALDPSQLYALGLAHVQRLSSRVWNDYNVHDPGITTLELLSFALTDLSYRASFPVADLLASAPGGLGSDHTLFTARQILPNRPLTELDLRKLLIDLPGVKNAWLRPAPITIYADLIEGRLLDAPTGEAGVAPVVLRGLYDVRIDFMEDVTTAARRAEIIAAARARLHANRNLCEDWGSIETVETQEFNLCAELELTSDADVSTVRATLLFEVGRLLAPPVNVYALSEMLARTHADGTPYTVDEIFDGPALDCGFIDDDELAAAALPTEIRLSDVISVIMDIPGVRAVRDILVTPTGATTPLENRWVIPVISGRKPVLRHASSRLVFTKGEIPVLADETEVTRLLTELSDASRQKLETPRYEDLAAPVGRVRDTGSSHSFQNSFPNVYGIGPDGLGESADTRRKMLALQLKGYLLFFDQVMADYLAQLRNVASLFSTNPAAWRTWFHQRVGALTEADRLYDVADIETALQGALDDEDQQIERRNRFLDHLIARFAERFFDYVGVMRSAFGTTPAAAIRAKAEFLRDYPAVSSGRGMAYDHSLSAPSALWNSDNVSGYERRLARLLGIPNFTRRNLSDIAFDTYAEIDGNPTDEFRFRVRDRVTHKILLSSSTHYATTDLATAEMRTAITLAKVPEGYSREQTASDPPRHYFNIIDSSGEVVARRIEYWEHAEDMEDAIAYLQQYLNENYSDEGMYVIENILLRKQQPGDPFLPICPDPNCVDCAEADPYSYRMHVILPAYGARFSNMEFRRYVEQVVRAEAPAHVLPKVCWLSALDMAALEEPYRAWISLEAGVTHADRAARLQAFFDVLFRVKSSYPQQTLGECGSDTSTDRFILGQTALGTSKT